MSPSDIALAAIVSGTAQSVMWPALIWSLMHRQRILLAASPKPQPQQGDARVVKDEPDTGEHPGDAETGPLPVVVS